MNVVFDTNILIDFLKGIQQARTELEQFHRPFISIITRLELLAGARTDRERDILHHLLRQLRIVPVDEEICDRAASLRKTLHLKTPDSIIYATAKQMSCPLVTRNSKDFPPDWVDVRCPYIL